MYIFNVAIFMSFVFVFDIMVSPRANNLKLPSPRSILVCSNFQFLLCQAFADDEASTRLLQILLFLLLSTPSLMFIPCAVRSSFTLSIHFFGCLPLLLVPSTCPYSANKGSLFPSILVADDATLRCCVL